MDILLAHGYFLSEDPHEQKVMKPYPPLGILYLSSYLKSRGYAVGVFNSTFQRPIDFEALLDREHPAVVGLYVNLMTKVNVLKMIGAAQARGAVVVLGGPEPAFYAADYLARGADVVVRGEGELTLDALLPHLARHGLRDLDDVEGVIWRRDDGTRDRECAAPAHP